ncbi:MAG: flagellar hook capping protein [Rhizobiales bacterium 65-9]|nr:flagellar hook assembly protein FlgD [Hyphomicrobiales bacterium]OJY39244.1 MAG: flagellar hook capping protein [Rhizobiales bacterium 65-9]
MVDSVSGNSNSSYPSSSSSKSGQMIASNFQAFLTLLTTQLKNQNPLDPLDTNQFTQQLVQFASVEQQLKSNDTLSALLTASQSTNLANATGFIGKTVTANGATAAMQDGSTKWNVNLPRAAKSVTLTVTDSNKNVVWTEQKSMSTGDNEYVWNGKTTTGQMAPAGDYNLTVTAVDATGASIKPSLAFSGVVDGVNVSNGATTLKIGDYAISLGQVTSVSR